MSQPSNPILEVAKKFNLDLDKTYQYADFVLRDWTINSKHIEFVTCTKEVSDYIHSHPESYAIHRLIKEAITHHRGL